MRSIFIAICAMILAACTTTQAPSQTSSVPVRLPESMSGWKVQPFFGYKGGQEGFIYLTETGSNQWRASLDGDVRSEGVERLGVDFSDKTIWLAAPIQKSDGSPGLNNNLLKQSLCARGSRLNKRKSRAEGGFTVCDSAFSKAAVSGRATSASGYLAEVDGEKLQDAFLNSGAPALIDDLRRAMLLKEYRSAFSSANTSAALSAFMNTYGDNDPENLVKLAKDKVVVVQKREKAEALLAYKAAYAKISSLENARRFIKKYQDNDPDGLIPGAKAKERRFLNKLREAELAREAERLKPQPIGRQVCLTGGGFTESRCAVDNNSGERICTKTSGDYELRGFVEAVSNNRIKIQISGMSSFHGLSKKRITLDSFDYQGNLLVNGAFLWDDGMAWKACDGKQALRRVASPR